MAETFEDAAAREAPSEIVSEEKCFRAETCEDEFWMKQWEFRERLRMANMESRQRAAEGLTNRPEYYESIESEIQSLRKELAGWVAADGVWSEAEGREKGHREVREAAAAVEAAAALVREAEASLEAATALTREAQAALEAEADWAAWHLSQGWSEEEIRAWQMPSPSSSASEVVVFQ